MVEIKHPGVFIEEIPSGMRSIEGVSTSTTAFVGRAWCGPADQAVQIASFADYQRQFGGLWRESTLGFAVRHFFENGGARAIVVRVATRSGERAAKAAVVTLKDGETFRAASAGSWGLNLKITIDHAEIDETADDRLFNLTVLDDTASKRDSEQRGGSGLTERFAGVSVDPASPQFVGAVLRQSQLLRLESGLRLASPGDQTAIALDGTDGAPIGSAEVTASDNRASQTGLYALGQVDLFNLLCIPPYAPDTDNDVANDWAPAAEYCRARSAFLIIDAPASWTADNAVANVAAFRDIAREYAALYFPRVLAPNPLDANKPAAFAPCGMVAGIMSRTDSERGVWKAPAGTGATLRGAAGLSINGQLGHLTDEANGRLSAAGINCLREFPTFGFVVWGARTLAGGDAMASEWKYVNVRRFFLFLEESINRGTQWVVFEPNSEPTWISVGTTVSSFLRTQWRSGALMGQTPQEAFFVKCDRSTMTEDDILNGRLIAIIGVAPMRPAEFVIFRISQKTLEANQ